VTNAICGFQKNCMTPLCCLPSPALLQMFITYRTRTHTHCLLVSCSQSIQIQTCLLMCAVWLLNSWPWYSYLHLICSPSVREHYLIIFHAAFVFAHHHHLKAPHENRELIAPRWPSCHRSISDLLFDSYNCLWPNWLFVWYLHKDMQGPSLWCRFISCLDQ
jgi:hypothetical protein